MSAATSSSSLLTELLDEVKQTRKHQLYPPGCSISTWRKEQIEAMVDRFLAVKSVARPTPTARPHEPLEIVVERAMLCKRIVQRFNTECKQRGIQYDLNNAVARWFITQKMAEECHSALSPSQFVDPIIPAAPCSDAGLVHKLMTMGMLPDTVAAVEKMLKELCTDLHKRISLMFETFDKVAAFTHPALSPCESSPSRAVNVVHYNDYVKLTYGDVTVKVNANKYVSLRQMWMCIRFANYQPSGDPGTPEETFNRDIFCMLSRYEAIPVGGGYHAAAPEPVFRLLNRVLGVTHECFASPLNRSDVLPFYCSAYPDVDAPFGSLGSVWDVVSPNSTKLFRSPCGISLEANPPFLEEVLYALAKTINSILARPAFDAVPISFTLILPDWQDTPAIVMLLDSPFYRYKIRIGREEHAYIYGRQYRPAYRKRFRNVMEDDNQHPEDSEHVHYANTLIVLLQNDAGVAKWPFREKDEQQLREAFVAHVE